MSAADALIAEAAQHAGAIEACGTDADARMRLARQTGRLEGIVRRLCADIAELRSAAGIAESIAALPSRHADLLTVATALRDRIEAEDGRGNTTGYDTVAELLGDAVGAMEDCYAVDLDAMRAEYESERYADETRDARSVEFWEQRA